jgi:hypothetical protein
MKSLIVGIIGSAVIGGAAGSLGVATVLVGEPDNTQPVTVTTVSDEQDRTPIATPEPTAAVIEPIQEEPTVTEPIVTEEPTVVQEPVAPSEPVASEVQEPVQAPEPEPASPATPPPPVVPYTNGD